MHTDIERVLFSAETIQARVTALGREITERIRDRKEVVILGLLKGSVLFLADLVRSIDLPVKLEFAWVSSYGHGTESSGNVHLKVFPDEDLVGRTVIIVDDILDTGRTLHSVKSRLLTDHGVADVQTCVLLDKAARRVAPVKADFVGFEVEDVFVVGYGLDYQDHYRNLPYIGVLHERMYKEE
ncbi:MAG TPA: hypoxanthine phosphoribosyltransferase [Planctomycetota bacterium]|jgi:hypoxanthine phosphoribosyltransferase|nr:hypoxanthine phosphoribosyltransferase [Planctomycetota bacterium]